MKVDAVDKDGKFINYLKPSGSVTGPGPNFEHFKLDVHKTGPGIYEGSFPLDDTGVYMLNLHYTDASGSVRSIPAGLSLGYSSEYEYNTTNLPLIEQMASLGGGSVLEPETNPFVHDLVATPSSFLRLKFVRSFYSAFRYLDSRWSRN